MAKGLFTFTLCLALGCLFISSEARPQFGGLFDDFFNPGSQFPLFPFPQQPQYPQFPGLHEPSSTDIDSNEGNKPQAPSTCDKCTCGVKKSTRIVNGEGTTIADFPWMARIKYGGQHHCGGSLITHRHILTAAHCFIGARTTRGFSITLGDGQTHKIKSIVTHRRFVQNEDVVDNDIAIIELVQPVTLGKKIQTVCLPEADVEFSGKTGIATGWGKTHEVYGDIPRNLQKVDLPIMSKQECARSHYSLSKMSKNMICAGYLRGGRDTCQGDSGGPLVVRGENGNMILAGIVSFGKGCARPGYPGIYTKVSNFLGWINNNLDGECLCSPPQ